MTATTSATPSRLLDNKIAYVTGGGSGIGRAACRVMAREGARVAVLDRDLKAAEETVELVRAAGGEALAFVADVSDAQQVEQSIAQTLSHFGRLDCAFNNAGVGSAAVGSTGMLTADLTLDAWNRTIAVNLSGVFHCLKYQLAAMVKQGGGAIVNNSSIGGLAALRGSSAYVAAKHGVIGLTKNAAVEYGAHGIRVNAVCPGHIDTPLLSASNANRSKPTEPRNYLGRYGQAEEIAELVVWLLSDRASFCSGAAYLADGARLAG